MKIICTEKEKDILLSEIICPSNGLCECATNECRADSCAECFKKTFNVEWEIIN